MENNVITVDHQFDSISEAFLSNELQRAVSTAIEWAPEVKNEALLSTLLSAVLNRSGVQSMREVRIERTRSSRRHDMKINDLPLEAKYHFEFDIESICRSLARSSTELAHLGHKPFNSWSAGDAFLKELSRTRNSYFLWSVCDRGPDPVPNACMRKNALAWHRELCRRGVSDSRAYLEEQLEQVMTMSKATMPGLHVRKLPDIEGGSTRLRSFLFFR